MTYSSEAILTPELANALLRMIGCETGSPIYDEDLSQDVLLRGVVAFRRVGLVSNPLALFRKIVREALYDSWRRRRSARGLDSYCCTDLTDRSSLDEMIDRKRRLQHIVDALGSLSEAEQCVITFFYFEELPIAEISELLGRSQSAVKMALFRARKKILELIARQSPPV